METLVQAPAWVRERREQASRRFAEVGFPNTRQEDWRFTNVAPIADAKFALANGAFAQAASLIAGVKRARRADAGDRQRPVRRGPVGSQRDAEGRAHCRPS